MGAIALAQLATISGARAQPSDFTVGGAFDNLNDVLQIEFSHPGGPFTAFTSQWNGGGPPSGPDLPVADPPLDGFDAQIQLFIGTGPAATFVSDDDDSGNGFSRTVDITTFTGGSRDSLLDFASLPAGNYTLGLTNYNNDPAGSTLLDGYDNNGDDGSNGIQGFTGTQFRVHLLGIDQVLSASLKSELPVSVSGPFEPPPS